MPIVVYPVCLNIAEKTCIIIGGGEVAERKVAGLLGTGARIRVISPEATGLLHELARKKRIEWLRRPYQPHDLDDGFLIFAATNDSTVQKKILTEAQRLRKLINIVDQPDQCGFQVPATLQRGNLTLAVATAGKSPAVAAMIKSQLEKQYPAEYGFLIELMGLIRRQIGCSGTQDERKILFKNVLEADIVSWIRGGQWHRLEEHLCRVLGPETKIDLCELQQHYR